LDHLVLGQHLLDPDDPGAVGADLVHAGRHFPGDLRGVGCTCAQHHLDGRIDVRDCVHEVDDAFLTRDAADEQHVGPVRIDPVLDERIDRGVLAILMQINSVMDHLDLGGVNIEVIQHIVAGFLRHRDHRVGLRDAVVLDPGTQVVGVAELFHLPGPQRLQRVGG